MNTLVGDSFYVFFCHPQETIILPSSAPPPSSCVRVCAAASSSSPFRVCASVSRGVSATLYRKSRPGMDDACPKIRLLTSEYKHTISCTLVYVLVSTPCRRSPTHSLTLSLSLLSLFLQRMSRTRSVCFHLIPGHNCWHCRGIA